MTKTLRTALAADIDAIEQQLDEMDRRLDGMAARLDWMATEMARARGQLIPPAGAPPQQPPPDRPPRPLLNGSWPQRDGNTYPHIQDKGPIGGYESYVRRSPPATD